MTQITLTVEKRSTVSETFDVTFPIYRRHHIWHDFGSAEIFARINADMTVLKIHRNRSESGVVDWEVEHDKEDFRDSSGVDYHLGRGEYACTAEKFNEVVAELQFVLLQAVQ